MPNCAKNGKSEWEGGLTIMWNSEGWGECILEFPKARGVKIWKPSVGGYGYFLESPNACPEMAAEKHVMYMKTLIYLVFLRSEQPTCIISQFLGFIY